MAEQAPRFAGLSLDAGGVLLAPDHHKIAALLAPFGIRAGAHEVDRAFHSGDDDAGFHPGEGQPVVEAFAHRLALRLGASEAQAEDVRVGLYRVLEEDWLPRTPDVTVPALARLSSRIPVVITTNSDGRAAHRLRRYGIAHTGDGRGARVRAVVDSGVVGSAKPEPEIFHKAALALSVPPERMLHIGDSTRSDVRAAHAAGCPAAHFDPYRRCPASDHVHVRTLDEVEEILVPLNRRASARPQTPQQQFAEGTR